MKDKVEQFIKSNTHKQNVAFAIFCSELVIDVFENEYPDDNSPRNAIIAAKTWLDNPCEETARATQNAAAYAANAIYAIYAANAASYAYYAALSAYYAYYAVDAARYAADVAAVYAAANAVKANANVEQHILNYISRANIKPYKLDEDLFIL